MEWLSKKWNILHRRTITNFSRGAVPLSKLTKTTTSDEVNLVDECSTTFTTLKRTLMQPQFLFQQITCSRLMYLMWYWGNALPYKLWLWSIYHIFLEKYVTSEKQSLVGKKEGLAVVAACYSNHIWWYAISWSTWTIGRLPFCTMLNHCPVDSLAGLITFLQYNFPVSTYQDRQML